MKRLTWRDPQSGKAYPKIEMGQDSRIQKRYDQRVIDKLAAYEDTGLEPEEISCINRGDKECDADQICACMGIVSKRIKRLEGGERNG